MLQHRFRQTIPLHPSEEEFLSTVDRGTFRGFARRIWRKMMCFAKVHDGPLHIDVNGFYRICDYCGFYQKVNLWNMQKRRRK